MSELHESEQVNRLVQLAHQLDERVWSRNGFPAEDRPDLDYLLPGLTIDSNSSYSLTTHPVLKQLQSSPSWADLVAAGMADNLEQYEVEEEKKIAQYDPLTRKVSISPVCLTFPEAHLKRILAHELGTDNYGQGRFISYDQLPAEMQKNIAQFILQFRQMGVQLDGTVQVYHAGATQYLLIDGYLASSISPPLAKSLDEVYPTIFELVTSELDKRGGSIRKFERDIQRGKLRLEPDEQHPKFTTSLFKALPLVDWRVLLQAFRQQNWEDGLSLLGKQSQYGGSIFASLINDMEHDEHEVERRLRKYMQLGYRNR